MISQNINIPIAVTEFSDDLLQKGTWIAVLHAQRIPPHIGLVFNGNYNSLTIKEHELNIDLNLLLKTIKQKKIKSVFVRVVSHPVFSIDHQLSMFQEILKKYSYVKQFESTCLSPVKQFFREFYVLNCEEKELFFEFMQHMSDNKFIDTACALNLELTEGIDLPCYTHEELNEKIKNERQPYYND